MEHSNITILRLTFSQKIKVFNTSPISWSVKRTIQKGRTNSAFYYYDTILVIQRDLVRYYN